jgi:hypothetical protein
VPRAMSATIGLNAAEVLEVESRGQVDTHKSSEIHQARNQGATCSSVARFTRCHLQ